MRTQTLSSLVATALLTAALGTPAAFAADRPEPRSQESHLTHVLDRVESIWAKILDVLAIDRGDHIDRVQAPPAASIVLPDGDPNSGTAPIGSHNRQLPGLDPGGVR